MACHSSAAWRLAHQKNKSQSLRGILFKPVQNASKIATLDERYNARWERDLRLIKHWCVMTGRRFTAEACDCIDYNQRWIRGVCLSLINDKIHCRFDYTSLLDGVCVWVDGKYCYTERGVMRGFFAVALLWKKALYSLALFACVHAVQQSALKLASDHPGVLNTNKTPECPPSLVTLCETQGSSLQMILHLFFVFSIVVLTGSLVTLCLEGFA